MSVSTLQVAAQLRPQWAQRYRCDKSVKSEGDLLRFPAGGRVRFRLIPREERFYDDFVALAEQITAWDAVCSRRCSARASTIWDKADEIKEVEHKCDFLTHEIIQRLNRPSSRRSTARTSTRWPARSTM